MRIRERMRNNFLAMRMRMRIYPHVATSNSPYENKRNSR